MPASDRIDGRRQLVVVEGRLLDRCRGVHQNEFRAPSNGLRVPEVIRFADPVRGTGLIDYQTARLRLQSLGTLVVGQGPLGQGNATE